MTEIIIIQSIEFKAGQSVNLFLKKLTFQTNIIAKSF